MNREQAEKLLAALIFDDLDEPSKAELLAYLQTDDGLRERLADMRMAVKLAGDAVNEGPTPVLSENRLKELKQLAGAGKPRTLVFTLRCVMAVAAVLMIGSIFAGMVVRNFGVKLHSGSTPIREGRSLSALTDSESGVVWSVETDSSAIRHETVLGKRLGDVALDTKTDGSPMSGIVYGLRVDEGQSVDKYMENSDEAPAIRNAVTPSEHGDRAWAFESRFGREPELRTDTSQPSVGQPASALPVVTGPVASAAKSPALGDTPIAGRLFEELSDSDSDSRGRVGGDRTGIARRKRAMDPNATELAAKSRFAAVPVNPWVMTDRDSLSTFGLDVDTASYAVCRRYIRGGFLPPVDAVRMEEFVNAFDYAYPQQDGATFAVHAEGAASPFAPSGQDLTLLKIAVKARTVGRDQRRAAHLVFVVDASASMGQADRLPQVQAAMSLLVDKLSGADRVSLVTCANEARLHLEAVSAREKDKIRQTIAAIQPAGPTNLLEGLRVGYAMARRAFVAGQINQVVLCSDGVANVGATEAQDVLAEVDDDRRQGIALLCVGVGYGAYNDAFLESLADHGDGRYVFLDSSEQAREELIGQLASTLEVVARDARIQVQFDPACVRRYRLIGYENRDIEDQRFRDDTVDAGEVGSGQCSTALYEVELVSSSGLERGNLGTVSVRYRNAETGQIEEVSRPLAGSIVRQQTIEENPRFFLAAGVARFAEWLRQSEHARDARLTDVQNVLDRVSAVLPLDQAVRDVAALAHQAENLPRATETTAQP